MTKTKDELDTYRVFQLFFRYPLRFIPVVGRQSIKAFISKQAILKQANNKDFFERDFLQNLNSILVYNVEETFYQQLDENPLREIPVIFSESLQLQLLAIREFNTHYRPIQQLETQDFPALYEQLPMPTVVINAHHQLIYQNEKVKDLLRSFQDASGFKHRQVLKFLPALFFERLEKNADEKVYSLEAGTVVYSYRIQSLLMERGRIYIIYFLFSNDDSF